MTRYSVEPRTTNNLKGYEFLSSPKNLTNKHQKQLSGTAIKTELDALKTVF